MKVKELMALLSLRDPEAIVRIPAIDWQTSDGEMKKVEHVVSVDLTKSYGSTVVDLE